MKILHFFHAVIVTLFGVKKKCKMKVRLKTYLIQCYFILFQFPGYDSSGHILLYKMRVTEIDL